jgi:hypothetical protein
MCTERTETASITVTLYTIYVINTNMTLQIVIAANNNIIAISFFDKTRTEKRGDTGRGTRLGSGNSTSPYSTLFTSPLISIGMPYS